MRHTSWITVALLLCTFLLTGCRDPEADVHNQIRHDAEELSDAAADLARRGALQNHSDFQTSLRALPYSTTRGFRDFRWEGDALHVLVSFSSNIQRTEAEGAGRYSALSCANLTVDSETVELLPASCPAEVPLEYGSHDPVDYQLPEIRRKVQNRR
jgi:predicted small secreted protein